MKLENLNAYTVVGLLILCLMWWPPGFSTSSSSSFWSSTIKSAITQKKNVDILSADTIPLTPI